MTDVRTSSHISDEGLIHEALMYRSGPELTETVEAFVREAAEAHEPVLVALPGEMLERVRAVVGDGGADGRSEVRFEDMRDIGRNPSRLLPMMEDWVREHEAEGRVRMVSETVWPGRSYPETAECLRHEALLNQVLAQAPATILCPFDAEQLDPETLAGAEATHPTVLEGGRRRPSTSYGSTAPVELDERWPLEPSGDPVSAHDLGPSLQELRHAVADDPLISAMTEDRRSDFLMAVNEAATNAVRYGDGSCSARIWHDGRGVVAEISSVSEMTDPLAGRCPRPEPDAVSGRGLWLINQVCDLVELRSGEHGTTMRLHMQDAA